MEVRSIFVKIWRFLLKRPIYEGVTGESEDAYGKVVITKEYAAGEEW